MRAIVLALAIALLLPALTRGAAAQVIVGEHTLQALYTCEDGKLYEADGKGAPGIIARSFTGEVRRIVFRTCEDADGNTHYFIRKPRPNRNGVCRVFESEVFPGSKTDYAMVDTLHDGSAADAYFDMYGWTETAPKAWSKMGYTGQSSVLGFATKDSCPLGDDPRYIRLSNVTDGMLTSFHLYWEKITRSEQALRAAIQNVPTVSGPGEAIDASPSKALRDEFVAAAINGHSRAFEISCDTEGCRAFFSQGPTVAFDAGPDGIILVALEAVWVT
jgi:hypothetical protein